MRDYLCSPFLLVQKLIRFLTHLQANNIHFHLAEDAFNNCSPSYDDLNAMVSLQILRAQFSIHPIDLSKQN